MTLSHDDRLAATALARDAAYALLGTPAPHVLAVQVESGPPWWPTRRAYREILRDDALVLVTSGLADPWPEPGAPGYGVELLVEVPRAHAAAPWVFHAIATVAEGLIRPGQRFRERLDHHGTLSNELPGAPFPPGWATADGRVGVLFGVPAPELPPGFATPDGEVRLVPITLLRPAELRAIVRRDEARGELAARLAALPRGHACRPERPSLVEDEAPEAPPARRPWWRPW